MNQRWFSFAPQIIVMDVLRAAVERAQVGGVHLHDARQGLLLRDANALLAFQPSQNANEILNKSAARGAWLDQAGSKQKEASASASVHRAARKERCCC